MRTVLCTRQGRGMQGLLKNHSSFFTRSSILANNSVFLCHLLSLHTYPWHTEVRRLLSCLQAPSVFTHLTSLYKYVLIPTKWLKSRSICLLSFSTKILTLASVVTIIEQLTWRKLIFFKWRNVVTWGAWGCPVGPPVETSQGTSNYRRKWCQALAGPVCVRGRPAIQMNKLWFGFWLELSQLHFK